MSSSTIFLLTGDIGGTNSRMALYDPACQSCSSDEPLVVKYYRNAEHLPEDCHSHPEAFATKIVIPFLQYCWEEQRQKESAVRLPPMGQHVQILAVLATAGTVTNNQVRMTNLGNLLVDGTAIQENTKDPYLQHVVVCRIINDFVAQGYGCLTLKTNEVRHLFGPSDLDHLPVGPKVCVGAGTGLGECYLTPSTITTTADTNSSKIIYQCFPSEGGHVEYAPRNDLEIRMFKYLSEKFASKSRISVERVVSGKGLANVYEFLAQEYPTRIVTHVHDEFLAAGDEQGRVVATNATENSLCQEAMSIMMSAYGCEAGSAAIKWMPTGGLFVTGGLTPKNIRYIDGLHTDFMISYRSKGRVRPLLERVPLFAVMVEDLGVRGAHKAALMEYESFVQGSSTSPAKNKSMLGPISLVPQNVLLLGATAAVGFFLGVMACKRRS